MAATCDTFLPINSRFSQNSWCAFLMFVVSGRRWKSLTGLTCRKAKALPVSLAEVPTLPHLAVDRNVEPWCRYERGLVSWPLELSEKTPDRQAVVMADTREGHVHVKRRWEKELAASFGSYSSQNLLNVDQEPRPSPSGDFAVSPVDMLAPEVAKIQSGVWERRDGRMCESRTKSFVDVNVYAQPLCMSLIALEFDWPVTIPTAREQTFLLRTDSASEKLGITSLSAVVQ